MAISPLVRPLCLFLGTLGLIQGLIFLTLALLGILVHLCIITVASDETLTSFVPLLVGLYVQGAECQVYNTTILHNDYFSNLITPEWLFIWMAIYVGVSGFWIISSILMMIDFFCNKKSLHYFLLFWIILTLGNCVIDLVLATYFGIDYTDLISNTEVNGTTLLPVVPFAMMIISLKGCVLWLINFFGSIFAIAALHNFVKHKDDDKPLFLERAGFLDRNPIDGFAPLEVPRPTTLHLSSSAGKQNFATVSALRTYYMNHREEPRSDLQSPISDVPALRTWKNPARWDIPDPDYSPTSTVTQLNNETDSQATRLRHSLFNPTLPLRTSSKRKQQNYERKGDISL